MTERTRALYTLQHTQATPRGTPLAPPPPTQEQLDRAAAVSVREELLESRRNYWNQRWEDLRAGVVASIAADEPDEFTRSDLAMRAQYAAERVVTDAELRRLADKKKEENRERARILLAQRQERLALNIEAQRAAVSAQYYHDLLQPHRGRIWLQARQAEVSSLEETELSLRESARFTAREDALHAKRAAEEEMRRAAFVAEEKERMKREHGTEKKRNAKANAQARALHVRTGGSTLS